MQTRRPARWSALLLRHPHAALYAAMIVLGTLLFLWPAVYNGFPLAFYDTAQYLSSGQKSLAAVGFGALEGPESPAGRAIVNSLGSDGPFNDPGVRSDRSVYYGVFAEVLNRLGGFPAIVAMQALLAAAALTRTLHLLGTRNPVAQLLILAIVAALTPLPFFVSLVMPDIFGALMLLALAVVLTFHQRLRWPEVLLWSGLILAGALFHKAFLVMGVGTAAVAWLIGAIARRSGPAMALVAAPLFLGLAGTLLVNALVERVLDKRVVETPFLLARLVEDRTAERLLREDCPTVKYRTCLYVSELPMSENEFLWGKTDAGVLGEASGGFLGLSLEDRIAVSEEQFPIFLEILRRYPMQQFSQSMENFGLSLITVHLRRFQPPEEPQKELASKRVFYETSLAQMPVAMPKFAASKLWHGEFPLGLISAVSAASYLPTLVLLPVLIALHLRRRNAGGGGPEEDFIRVAVIVLVGLLANAAVSGIISGVSGRYQARFAWLPFFILLAGVWTMSNRRLTRAGAATLRS